MFGVCCSYEYQRFQIPPVSSLSSSPLAFGASLCATPQRVSLSVLPAVIHYFCSWRLIIMAVGGGRGGEAFSNHLMRSIRPEVAAWLQSERTLSCGCILPVSRFPTGFQTTFLPICSRKGSCSHPSSPVLRSPGSQRPAAVATRSGHSQLQPLVP